MPTCDERFTHTGIGLILNMTQKWKTDNLWVVAENQMGGYEACDSIGGHLHTYATLEEAQKEAEAIIDELNESSEEDTLQYDAHSWAGVLLKDAAIGDNQERITMPNIECSDPTGMECECMTIEEWNAAQQKDACAQALEQACEPPCVPHPMLGMSGWKNLGFNTACNCAEALHRAGFRYMSQYLVFGIWPTEERD